MRLFIQLRTLFFRPSSQASNMPETSLKKPRTSTIPIFKQLSYCLLAVSLILSLNFTRLSHLGQPTTTKRTRIPIPLIVTLHYLTWFDERYITHNCIVARRAEARMVIYTWNMTSKYCSVCECRPFVPANCPPPSNKPGATNHCEKLFFVVQKVPELREFIFIDADAVVMHDDFFRMFGARAQVHDFLAPYVEDALIEKPKYLHFFNSGLMFIRFVKGVNYTSMISMMYKLQTGFDQSIISLFVRENYERWDTLPFSWMCRRTFHFGYEIPAEKCLTIHNRRELEVRLKTLNRTLYTV